MITISAFKWVPEFAQGQVRDLRARWALEEAGLPYEVMLIGPEEQKSASYRALQPFGQVPAIDDDGLVLFESCAIVMHLGVRAEVLMPNDEPARKLPATLPKPYERPTLKSPILFVYLTLLSVREPSVMPPAENDPE